MLFKKRTKNLYAPIAGELIRIEEVKDEVFSQKMLGDGFAIVPEQTEFISPIDGVLTTVFPSGHAFGITGTDGMEVLIHIGIDTIKQDGKGFEVRVKQGDTILAKDPLVSVDVNYLKDQGYDMTTILIFTNPNSYKEFKCEKKQQFQTGEIIAKYFI